MYINPVVQEIEISVIRKIHERMQKYDDALNIDLYEKYDLIFIDAAKGQYIKFFEKFEKNLSEKGAIISDNLKFHGYTEQKERIKSKNLRQLVNKIRKYIEFLKENNTYQTTFYDIGDGIGVTKKRTDDC